MRTALRWLVLVVSLAGCVAAAFAAYRLATYSWDQVVSYRSPIELPLPAADAGPPLSERVILVIVDGLTDDASRRMPGLDTLRGYGADMVASGSQPSVSYPSWTTILSGAPPDVSGVTSNDFDERVPVETLLDTALRAGERIVVVGPTGLATLYGADRAAAAYLEDWKEGEYHAGRLVDKAVGLTRETSATFVLLHVEDVDEAGHDFGSSSAEYLEVAQRVDADLGRLIDSLQGPSTTFVVLSDHGHTATGGHGGWEPSVMRVPVVFAGTGVLSMSGRMAQADVAPTVAAISGIAPPRASSGVVPEGVLASTSPAVLGPARRQIEEFASVYEQTVLDEPGLTLRRASEDPTPQESRGRIERAAQLRLDSDRRQRLPLGLAVAGTALGVLVLIGVASWRALVAALGGAAVYYALYNGLFFVVHGYGWSLSAFNEESQVDAFLYARMAEAAVALLAGAAVAGILYPLMRKRPHGPDLRYAPGWLSLGPAVALTVLATLGLQVAWYLWAWGVEVTWRVPDLMAALKYDLDLTQATAVGMASVLAAVVTFVVGRYHPRVRRTAAALDEARAEARRAGLTPAATDATDPPHRRP